MSDKADMKNERALKDLIRKELVSRTNRRFLSRMSAFKPENEMPEQFNVLLNQLDRAERAR